MRRQVTVAIVLAWACSIAAPAGAACGPVPTVPGAEHQVAACLEDMTTSATRLTQYTDLVDWIQLVPLAQQNPSGVPGLQIDGYFPDDSKLNTTHGWDHDAQFVIRLPDTWNGKLVVSGAPGVRKQYAVDPIISDFVLADGYAYTATDKGNGGTAFYTAGAAPGDAGVEWNDRVTEIARAARRTVKAYYGRAPGRTYMTGISQGGYLTRWQIEHHPKLFDGGVDWEGTLWTSGPNNVLDYLAAGVKHFVASTLGDPAAHQAIIDAGFAPGSEFLWPDHYATYWDLTLRTYREEFDPDYDGPLPAGIPFCQSGLPSCDADYRLADRPDAQRALDRIALTGDLKRPLLSLHGTLDALLPIARQGDPYARMIEDRGRGARHRYYVIENGNHVDSRYDLFPDRIRPIQPCWRVAFAALDAWVDDGTAPPPSQFVADGHAPDAANRCALEGGGDPGPMGEPPVTTRRRPALRLRVRRRGGRAVVRGALEPPPALRGRHPCAGTVTVTVRTARGRIVRRHRLAGRCAFRVRVQVRGRVRVRARFGGNRLLRPVARRVVS